MWSANNLTRDQIVMILQLLYSSHLQQQVYINFQSPYREFLPFWENQDLQQRFLRGYARQIATIPRELYSGKLLFC